MARQSMEMKFLSKSNLNPARMDDKLQYPLGIGDSSTDKKLKIPLLEENIITDNSLHSEK